MLTPLDAPDDTEEQHMNTEVPAVLFSAQYMISTPTIPRKTKQISFFLTAWCSSLQKPPLSYSLP